MSMLRWFAVLAPVLCLLIGQAPAARAESAEAVVLDPHGQWNEGCGDSALTAQWFVEPLDTGGARVIVSEPNHSSVLNAIYPLHLEIDRTPILKLTYRATGLRTDNPDRKVVVFFGSEQGEAAVLFMKDLAVDGQEHVATVDLRERVPAEKREKAPARLDLRIHADAAGRGVLDVLDLRFEPASDAPPPPAATPLPAVTVKVVDLAGQPIEGATVRLDPHLVEPRIEATTNADGIATIASTHPQGRRAILVSREGMTAAAFHELLNLGTETNLTATLAPAGTYGGRVVNADGEPVPGAVGEVWLDGVDALNVHGRSGQARLSYVRRVRTDDQGRWTSGPLPDTGDVSIRVRWMHPGYLLDRWGGQYSGELSMADLRAGAAVSTLKRGLRFEGRVVDAQGNPIAGASIGQGQDRVMSNPPPSTTTDESGRFVFDHAEPGEVWITAKAKGYGPEMLQTVVGPDASPLEIKLGPPGTYRIKVVDAAGQPLKGVTIFADTWRGGRTLNHRFTTNAEGLATWTNGPTDEVAFDIFTRGKLDDRGRTIAASTGEDDVTVVTLREPLRVVATVTDEATGEPVPSFGVVTGILWQSGEPPHWERTRGYTGTAGRWEQEFTHSYPVRVVRIEAEGYAPAVSREILKDEGEVELSFALKAASSLTGRVVDAAGNPVAGETVRIVSGRNMPQVRNGRVAYDRESLQLTTDADGRFIAPPQEGRYVVVVYTDTGYAELDGEAFAAAGSTVTLGPWGRVQGTLRVGSKPAAGENVAIFMQREMDQMRSWPHHQLEVKTDTEGRFTFDRVPAGRGSIGRYIETGPQMHSLAAGHPIEIGAGETLDLAIGGNGRPVTGRFVWPEGAETVALTASMQHFATKVDRAEMEALLPEGFMTRSMEERRAWAESEEGLAYQRKVQDLYSQRRNFGFRLAADGGFRIEDVPPGTYELTLNVYTPAAGRGVNFQNPRGRVQHEVTVPPMPEGVSAMDEPFEIGDVMIQPIAPGQKVGDAAPALVVPVLDMSASDGAAALEKAETFDLSQHTGKVVLVDFWAVWCGPCIAETPAMKAAWEAGKDDPRFVMIGLSLDATPNDPFAYFRKESLGWRNGFLGDWAQAKAPNDWGVRGIPSVWLIGPDGKVLAKDLRGDRVKEAVVRALQALPREE